MLLPHGTHIAQHAMLYGNIGLEGDLPAGQGPADEGLV